MNQDTSITCPCFLNCLIIERDLTIQCSLKHLFFVRLLWCGVETWLKIDTLMCISRNSVSTGDESECTSCFIESITEHNQLSLSVMWNVTTASLSNSIFRFGMQVSFAIIHSFCKGYIDLQGVYWIVTWGSCGYCGGSVGQRGMSCATLILSLLKNSSE